MAKLGGRGNALVPYMGEARWEVPTECLLCDGRIRSMHGRLEKWRVQESRPNGSLRERRVGVAVKNRLVQEVRVSAAGVRLPLSCDVSSRAVIRYLLREQSAIDQLTRRRDALEST